MKKVSVKKELGVKSWVIERNQVRERRVVPYGAKFIVLRDGGSKTLKVLTNREVYSNRVDAEQALAGNVERYAIVGESAELQVVRVTVINPRFRYWQNQLVMDLKLNKSLPKAWLKKYVYKLSDSDGESKDSTRCGVRRAGFFGEESKYIFKSRIAAERSMIRILIVELKKLRKAQKVNESAIKSMVVALKRVPSL